MTLALADDLATIQAERAAPGTTVEVEGVELRFKGPVGALTSELREAVHSHKHDLLIALTGFAPLEDPIIRHTATNTFLEQIHVRLNQAQQMADT